MPTIREVLYQHTKGNSQREISRSFDISRDTIRKYIELAKQENFSILVSDTELNRIAIKVEEKLYKNEAINKATAMSILVGYKEEISNWLKERSITHTQIQRLLLAEGVRVSTRSINRYIKKEFPKVPKSTIHIKTEPGQEGQVDFGHVGKMQDSSGKNRKLYVFVMTLSHSRYRYVEFTFSQDQVSWARLHINAFNFFGGVPARIVLDNLKAGVIKPDIYDPTLNETYSELSRFYGFTIDPAKVYKPEHKGKVERSIRIVREQLIAGKLYQNITHANTEAIKWCQNEISHRVCRTTGTKPIHTFLLEEKKCMLEIASGIFDMPIWSICRVQKDHHFVAKGNFYSVPTKYIGEEISIRIGLKTVSAYYKHQIIKTHPRNYDNGQWITDEKDYPKSALYYLENTADKCLNTARSIGDATHQIIAKTVDSGSRIGLRKAQAILRLSETYGNDRLETACLRAVAYDNYAYETISNILKNKLDQQLARCFGANKVKNIKDSAYIRDSKEYSSDMEANYA
ncbi:MAG TPA: IS21 family transposase [Metabacillus sp.]|nr:IS21 family transposase [Metabacillus sp.]